MSPTWVLPPPWWAPCWPHEPCYQGTCMKFYFHREFLSGSLRFIIHTHVSDVRDHHANCGWMHVLDIRDDGALGCNMPCPGTVGPLLRYSKRSVKSLLLIGPNGKTAYTKHTALKLAMHNHMVFIYTPGPSHMCNMKSSPRMWNPMWLSSRMSHILMQILNHTGIHGNIGPRGICNTPAAEYAALCESYNSSVISYTELKVAYYAGFECYMCGWTTSGRYFFCQGSAGYCPGASATGNWCESCGNVYCKHSLGKYGTYMSEDIQQGTRKTLTCGIKWERRKILKCN